MAIIGLSFKAIEGKKSEENVRSEIKVNSVPRINSLKEIMVPTLQKKVISMDFEFVTSYDPKVGEIKIGGELLYLTDKMKELMDKWEKEKKLPEKSSLEVLNYLFRRCLLKVSNIAEDLQLPPPIPLPKIKAKEK
ncbi:MAG: hypothetical protein JW754_05845 [Candidatus Aenigmarchaeota archaeon]|nr:hypothetical protein [Candidatus Aenigmarchaeota archaeon]